MQGSETDYIPILALSVVCLLPVVPAAWKAASWKGDIFSKWSSRVDLAHAGLSERVKDELVALQTAIADVLGGAGDFSPAEIWADPEPLVTQANRCADLLRARGRVRTRFWRLRRLSTFLIPTLVVYVLGWLLVTLHFTDVLEQDWVKVGGLALGGVAVLGALAVFCVYAYLVAKLATAEELAAEDGS